MLQSISSEKKLVKPFKNCFLGPICTKRGSLLATPKSKNIFFGRNNKSRSSAFRNFLFYQNIICFDWVMNLFLSWVMLFVKKVSFPAKIAVGELGVLLYSRQNVSDLMLKKELLLLITELVVILKYLDRLYDQLFDPQPPPSENRTIDLLFKNKKSPQTLDKFSDPPLHFYVDVINVWSLTCLLWYDFFLF